MSEFAFELELCAHLEAVRPGIVARQLGASVADPGGRIVDVVCVDLGPEFDDRVAITGETIPDAAIDADVGPGRARYWKDAFPEDVHPEHARRAMDRACEIDFFEREQRNGREYVRQVARYPDWFGPILGIENKPDLGRPGDLEAQLRTDVSLALVDRCVLATESYVTRAHLNRIPDEVGVWRIHRESSRPRPRDLEIEVVRGPAPLPVGEAGIEPLERLPGRTDISVVAAESKARARRRLAERAYGKGWRTYEIPDCESCTPTDPAETGATLPYCEWAGRIVDAESTCGSSCPGYDPAVTDDEIAARDPDFEAERDRRTPWRADPTGRRRRQSGLDRFG